MNFCFEFSGWKMGKCCWFQHLPVEKLGFHKTTLSHRKMFWSDDFDHPWSGSLCSLVATLLKSTFFSTPIYSPQHLRRTPHKNNASGQHCDSLKGNENMPTNTPGWEEVPRRISPPGHPGAVFTGFTGNSIPQSQKLLTKQPERTETGDFTRDPLTHKAQRVKS